VLIEFRNDGGVHNNDGKQLQVYIVQTWFVMPAPAYGVLNDYAGLLNVTRMADRFRTPRHVDLRGYKRVRYHDESVQ
jgi:hypothetical protein